MADTDDICLYNHVKICEEEECDKRKEYPLIHPRKDLHVVTESQPNGSSSSIPGIEKDEIEKVRREINCEEDEMEEEQRTLERSKSKLANYIRRYVKQKFTLDSLIARKCQV